MYLLMGSAIAITTHSNENIIIFIFVNFFVSVTSNKVNSFWSDPLERLLSQVLLVAHKICIRSIWKSLLICLTSRLFYYFCTVDFWIRLQFFLKVLMLVSYFENISDKNLFKLTNLYTFLLSILKIIYHTNVSVSYFWSFFSVWYYFEAQWINKI